MIIIRALPKRSLLERGKGIISFSGVMTSVGLLLVPSVSLVCLLDFSLQCLLLTVKFIDLSNGLEFLDDCESYDYSSDEESSQAKLAEWPMVEAEGSTTFLGSISPTSYIVDRDASASDQDPGMRSLRDPMPNESSTANHSASRGAELFDDDEHNLSPLELVVYTRSHFPPDASTSALQSSYIDDLFHPLSSDNSRCLWPLQNADEITLLRHFMSDLCPWVLFSMLILVW